MLLVPSLACSQVRTEKRWNCTRTDYWKLVKKKQDIIMFVYNNKKYILFLILSAQWIVSYFRLTRLNIFVVNT